MTVATETVEKPGANSADVRLDLIRGDIGIQLQIAAMHIDIACRFAECRLDDRLETAVYDARDRMRAALALMAKLIEERRAADINGEAAVEWRAQRDGRRSA